MTTSAFSERKICPKPVASASAWGNAISLNEASPWLIEAFNNIGRLRQLTANWDGYGSPPIQEGAIASAWRLLSAVESEQLPVPTICPVTGGGVGVNWQLPGGELGIEVHPDGAAQYLLTTPGDGVEASEEGPLGADSGEQLRCLIARLITGRSREADASPAAVPELTEDDFIPGVEVPWVIAVPPKVVVRLRGKIVGHRPIRYDSALSDAEIANLMADDDDE